MTLNPGQIYAHSEWTEGVYARVVLVSTSRVLFDVWEVRKPGWQGSAELGLTEFAVIYRDGPYPASYVLGATMEAVKEMLVERDPCATDS
jgi:hypothetical protein